jgi:sec-independent protein translocase protein TatB
VNINFSELLVILVVTLLLFGPDKLPEIARQLGKLAGDARKATNAVRREFYNTVYQPAEEVKREMLVPGEALRSLKAQVLAPPEGSRGVSNRPAPTSNQSSSTKNLTPDAAPPADTDESSTSV